MILVTSIAGADPKPFNPSSHDLFAYGSYGVCNLIHVPNC
jgi:hypothetical protein